MSDQIQRRGGTTAQHSTFTGALREVTVDTTKSVVVVHDGATAGGFPLLRQDLNNLPTGVLAPTASPTFTGVVTIPSGASIAGFAPLAAPVFTGVVTGPFVRGEFRKDAPSSVAFTVTAAFAVSTQANLWVEVGGACYAYTTGTVVAMPTATTGTDYAIYACTDGTIRADANFTTPTGYTTSTSRKIGGFHYAPGGNATAQAGGNTTPYINAYSLWDLKFRPACNDPRGMALVAGNFWADIYLTNTDPDTNGTSKYNVAQATGTAPPKVPTKFGGNGTTTYTTLTWWEANEVLAANGKRSASCQEFAALAFGTTEASAIGTAQTSTILNAAYTSRWGIIQATGVLDVWGKDFGGGAGAIAWTANTTGRGSTYQLCNAVGFGGNWGDGMNAGSRYSGWNNSPASSSGSFGSRGVVDHLLLD